MAHLLRQRKVSLLGLLAGCAVVPAAVVHFFGETEVQIPGAVHFLPIAISAGLAAAAALALTLAGARRGDGRAVRSVPLSPRWPRCSRSTGSRPRASSSTRTASWPSPAP